MLSKTLVLILGFLTFPSHGGNGKTAFVLLGSTGDNACRPNGFWWGLFEAWCTGIFEEAPQTDLHIQVNNEGFTPESLEAMVLDVLQPFYATLQKEESWKCLRSDGVCSPDVFFSFCHVNIWLGPGKYNTSGQSANMSYISEYDKVISYMNIPPFAYGEWALAMVKDWGGGSKLQIAVEKPFGGGRNSLAGATKLHSDIMASGLPESSLHLTDHWLSFFMNKHLPDFRKIIEPQLGIEWSRRDIERIVVTEYETRGFGGRGSFIDGLGQVRDMVQSHLLQVLSLLLVDSGSDSISEAKLDILNSLALNSCDLWQFDGLLESKWLKYHPDFADTTFARVNLSSSLDNWKDVEIIIETGKAMDENVYSIDVYQRGGNGVLNFAIGKEEVGIGGIWAKDWPLKDTSGFSAPLPGFDSSATLTVTPRIADGTIVEYSDPSFYFPKAYSLIVVALIRGSYEDAFVTWPECKKSWEILTDSSPAECLDPPPEKVKVYLPAFLCDKKAPALCDQHETVKDKYDVTYSCTPQHDAWYKDMDLYKAKCLAQPKLIFA